jgi:16S rRNA (guanine966-N2)-methyltransferase
MVRVIAGELKHRSLKTLPGRETRPTSDRLKESLFNLLQNKIEGCHFLDCFAGSGSIGIEAISRGASGVTFVESSPKAVRVIQENLNQLELKLSGDCRVMSKTIEDGIRILQQAGKKFDIVFLDPPYAANEQYPKVFGQLQECDLLNDDAVVIAEHSKFVKLEGCVGNLRKIREVRQGDSMLSLYRRL